MSANISESFTFGNFGLEGHADSQHQLNELAQRWKDRLVLERLVWSKDYVEGRYAIAFVVSVGPGSGRRPFPSGKKKEMVGKTRRRVVCVCNDASAPLRHGRMSDYQPVFVGPVEVIEGNQRIPSLIRAYGFENGLGELRGESLYFSVSRLRYDRLPILVYRKSGAYRVHPCIDVNRASDVVEGGSEVVNGITNDAAEVGVWESLFGRDNLQYQNAFRIEVGVDGVRVEVAVGLTPFFDIEDVLVGPFDL